MLKTFCFNGGHQIFQISPGIKSLYDWGIKIIHLLTEEAYFGTGEAISAI